MKIHTRQSCADSAPAKWARQYGHEKVSPHHAEITKRLAGLASPIDPDQVDSIIGNKSWTEPERCSECEQHKPMVVEVGQEPDYESATAWLCLDCLKSAFALATKEAAA